MKMMIEFKETHQGNVEFTMRGQDGEYTAKEKAYMEAVIQVLRQAVPQIGKQLGAKAAIISDPKANPQNQ